MHECTDASRQRHGKVTTANPVYRCEELEGDVTSVYDDIDDNQYDDLNEKTIYLDVLADETEECDQRSKPELPRAREPVYLEVLSDEGCDKSSIPQLPSPRPVLTSQNHSQVQDDDCEALKQKSTDHV